jgi:hypothetical protein
MLESGLSGSVRGASSNGHSYRDPRPTTDLGPAGRALLMTQSRDLPLPMLPVDGSNCISGAYGERR